MLREKLEVEKAGWRKDFTVMAPDEEEDLALTLTAEYGLKIKYKNRLKKRLEQEYQWYLEGRPIPRYKDDLFKLYPIIESEKKKQNKMTFSDLLRVSTLLLKEQDAFIPKWIIVDEVQDSDKMQMEFLEALKGRETKLFAVGDPNQVIYSWRGTGENMFFLLKHRFEAKEYSLPVNYRSNALILGSGESFPSVWQSDPGEQKRVFVHDQRQNAAAVRQQKLEYGSSEKAGGAGNQIGLIHNTASFHATVTDSFHFQYNTGHRKRHREIAESRKRAFAQRRRQSCTA